MTLKSCEEVIGDYLTQLQADFYSSPEDNACFLATPFVRPDGESIEIELRALPDGHVRISDMGDTLNYLYVNGLTLSRSVMAVAHQISETYGVFLHRSQLNIQVDAESIGSGIHGLIQATLGVSDLIQKRRPTSRVAFDDEVESFIIYSGVTYDSDYVVRGRRERHTIKFHVDSGRNLLIQPLHAAQESAARSWAERLAYRFGDILSQGLSWRPVVVLDDRNERSEVWSERAMTPIRDYAIGWSDRSALESMLKNGRDVS